MSGIYGNYDNVSDKEITGFPPFTIVAGVVLKKVEYYSGLSKAGSNYEAIRFTYVKDSNDMVQMYTDQVMPLNKDNMKNWTHKVSLDDTFQKEVDSWNTKMKHIASKFGISLEELTAVTGGSSSFKDYATKYCVLMNERIDDRKLFIKFMGDKDGRPDLPKYPPFLQVMENEDTDCILKYSTKEEEQKAKLRKNMPKSGSMEVESVLEISDDLDL